MSRKPVGRLVVEFDVDAVGADGVLPRRVREILGETVSRAAINRLRFGEEAAAAADFVPQQFHSTATAAELRAEPRPRRPAHILTLAHCCPTLVAHASHRRSIVQSLQLRQRGKNLRYSSEDPVAYMNAFNDVVVVAKSTPRVQRASELATNDSDRVKRRKVSFAAKVAEVRQRLSPSFVRVEFPWDTPLDPSIWRAGEQAIAQAIVPAITPTSALERVAAWGLQNRFIRASGQAAAKGPPRSSAYQSDLDLPSACFVSPLGRKCPEFCREAQLPANYATPKREYFAKVLREWPAHPLRTLASASWLAGASDLMTKLFGTI